MDSTDGASDDYSVDDGNQLPLEDTLIDRGLTDALDEGYSPPERRYPSGAWRPRESISELLAEEEPDPASRIGDPLDQDAQMRSDQTERDVEFPEHREVGRARTGRLVAPDMGFGEDTEAQLVAEDVGISGGAACAEEAAVHTIDSDDLR